jgi:hypothetical protein
MDVAMDLIHYDQLIKRVSTQYCEMIQVGQDRIARVQA